MSPMAMTPASTRTRAVPPDMPSFSICRYQATDMAMIATIDRSMPRPMMMIAMPTARMPSTLTLRTIATRLSAVKKPPRPTDAARNSRTARANTIRSWVMPPNVRVCAIPVPLFGG